MKIKYRFLFPDETREEYTVDLGCAPKFRQEDIQLPKWTALSEHQCPHCPLDPTEAPRCPLAASIATIIARFDTMISFDQVTVKVATPDRMYANITTVQRGLSSLLGLVIATSGCPHMDFFRPMARFHLPFASEEETIYRVAGMYLVGQYLRTINGNAESISLDGLAERYRKVEIVNTHIALRLRAATTQDASVNALVILDFFAKTMPYVIEDKLEDLKELFACYLQNEP